MTLAELIYWWNLIFALPFGFFLFLTLLQAIGALHLGHIGGHLHLHGHADHSFHLGHGHHIDHAGPDHAGPHGTHAGHDQAHAAHHGDAGNQQGMGSRFFGTMLALLGLGKAPFMVVLSTFGMLWGFVGLIANKTLGQALPPGIFVWWSVLIAFTVAFVTTGLLSRGIAKVMPSEQSFSESETAFAGRIGKAVTKITSQSGSVSVLDRHRNLIELHCHTEGDEVIARGTEVVLLYMDVEDGDNRRYLVCPVEDAPLRFNELKESLRLSPETQSTPVAEKEKE